MGIGGISFGGTNTGVFVFAFFKKDKINIIDQITKIIKILTS